MTNNIELTPSQRSAYRKTLLNAGIKTRGMADEKLKQKHDAIAKQNTDDLINSTIVDKTPVTSPKPSKSKATPDQPKAKKGNGAAPVEPNQPVSADAISAAITAAIAAAMAGTTGAAAIDVDAVKALIVEHANTPTIVNHIVQVERKGKQTKITGAHPALAKVLDTLSVGENVYMVGGAGVGKTQLAIDAAKALDMKFYATGAVLDKYELVGFVDAGGKYHETDFYLAIKNGGVFLWDEIDASLPSALNYFNAVLENGFITFPNGEHFEVDRMKTVFLCAANTIGTGATRAYVGRFELDRAFLDRFTQIELGYDHSIEMSIAKSAWNSAGGDMDKIDNAVLWAKTVQDFRALLDKRGILALCTTRAIRRGAKFLAIGWSLEDVKKAELYRHLSADQLKQLNV